MLRGLLSQIDGFGVGQLHHSRCTVAVCSDSLTSPGNESLKITREKTVTGTFVFVKFSCFAGVLFDGSLRLNQLNGLEGWLDKTPLVYCYQQKEKGYKCQEYKLVLYLPGFGKISGSTASEIHPSITLGRAVNDSGSRFLGFDSR
ncbi:unnamed protein product [Ilex paraguariensis]|uniref:Uncharacterized protein n=1 Tax=Ilex paraguariensis TaxID=185542 RepID=A0ABC8U909_9AQUA